MKVDPKKLLGKLDQLRKEKPFRYVGRRLVQAMAECASENPLVGKRSAPGRYLVVRLVENRNEKDRWEQLFAESRPTVLRELEREAAVREIKLRSTPELDLVVLTDEEAERGEAERVLLSVLEPDEGRAALTRLTEERELVLPRRVRTLYLESDPPEAAVYLDDRQAGVTPCRVEDVPDGSHELVFSRPGYLPYEDTLRIEPGRTGQRINYLATLEPEPVMGLLEVRTFPPRARVTIGAETRDSPCTWRLPAGRVTVQVDLDDFEPETTTVDLPPAVGTQPHRLQMRLHYVGPERDVVVGRLVVYKPTSHAPAWERRETPVGANRISSFFGDGGDAPEPEPAPAPDFDPDEVLGERPLTRGVLLIGRADAAEGPAPDIRLFDAENSVSRGCHAWLWIYADTSTGAVYNTFLVGNNSPAGIRVDGTLVMESRRLADDSEIEIGNFRMRLVKETPEPRVEFGF